MMRFRSMLKEHYEKCLPGMVEELKKEGNYEKILDSEAELMTRELADMVSGGAQVPAAMEIIYKEYFTMPETSEENLEEDTE